MKLNHLFISLVLTLLLPVANIDIIQATQHSKSYEIGLNEGEEFANIEEKYQSDIIDLMIEHTHSIKNFNPDEYLEAFLSKLDIDPHDPILAKEYLLKEYEKQLNLLEGLYKEKSLK